MKKHIITLIAIVLFMVTGAAVMSAILNFDIILGITFRFVSELTSSTLMRVLIVLSIGGGLFYVAMGRLHNFIEKVGEH